MAKTVKITIQEQGCPDKTFEMTVLNDETPIEVDNFLTEHLGGRPNDRR